MKVYAYTGLVQPSRLADVAPDATFECIAHLPEHGLGFIHRDRSWDGGLPSAQPEPGSIIWGAVFEVSKSELSAIKKLEKSEGRTPRTIEVMDRVGKRHEVTAFFHTPNGSKNGAYKPSDKYLRFMLEGARHWSLPAGWIAGLEEHLNS